MFLKHPFCLLFAPKKDGIYIVRHNRRVRYIGVAFQEHTGKNIRQALKYHFKNDKTEITFMYEMPELTSVKSIPMASYETALEERDRLILKHKKSVAKYHKINEENK
ncbi:MAG: hypothetical protein KAU02_01475 [Tenericutes bacterium]|nr:hypothetical protein [Mycoplasmatota bacterium]